MARRSEPGRRTPRPPSLGSLRLGAAHVTMAEAAPAAKASENSCSSILAAAGACEVRRTFRTRCARPLPRPLWPPPESVPSAPPRGKTTTKEHDMFTATAIGRLTKDPVLETTPTDAKVCKFRLACDKSRGRDGANYIDIVVWRGVEDNHTPPHQRPPGRRVGPHRAQPMTHRQRRRRLPRALPARRRDRSNGWPSPQATRSPAPTPPPPSRTSRRRRAGPDAPDPPPTI